MRTALRMHIVAVAWMFVVVLMAAADARAGAYLSAVATFVGCGLLPLAIVLYLLQTPSRRRRQRVLEASSEAAEPVQDTDSRG